MTTTGAGEASVGAHLGYGILGAGAVSTVMDGDGITHGDTDTALGDGVVSMAAMRDITDMVGAASALGVHPMDITAATITLPMQAEIMPSVKEGEVTIVTQTR